MPLCTSSDLVSGTGRVKESTRDLCLLAANALVWSGRFISTWYCHSACRDPAQAEASNA